MQTCEHTRKHTQDTLLSGFDFIVTPLVRPGHKLASPDAPSTANTLPSPLCFDDVLYLNSSEWVRQVRAL
jgi:hypothetical protein